MNEETSEMTVGRRLQPFPRSLPAILMRAREAVMTRVRPVLRAYDMTEPQWRVLRTLASTQEVEVTHLAEMVFLLPSSLSRILRDLTDRGLIQRRTSASDLRKGLVSISDQGMALIEAATPKTAKVTTEIERLFGADRLGRLIGLLEELEEAVGPGQPASD
ncbi:MAG TPA: homoprotocatechuate degradation operon regulator HpaR [Caulobacteraceae bacterium]